MHYVFLSYARTNSEISDRLMSDLKRHNITVWRDKENIRKDKGWDSEIEKILDGNELTHFLFVETPNSCREGSICRDEIERAIVNNIPILRLRFEPSPNVPLRIIRKTYIDFQHDYDASFKDLISELAKTTRSKTDKLKQAVTLSPTKQPTANQINAAHAKENYVRLVAPPGTGKSFVIEERVRWLLEQGVKPSSIFVISFTRASSTDLRKRIVAHCESNNISQSSQVRVSTLHSLALTLLVSQKLLLGYPTEPTVLDDWEQDEILDAEIAKELGTTPKRCEQIRRVIEAYWCTGTNDFPKHLQAEIPVTPEEIAAFNKIYPSVVTPYAAVLPGEIVKKCVESIEAGLLNPPITLKTSNLIIDEFQDLNYIDNQLINSFAGYSNIYVSGDDDQSIYGFRFAYPRGIQDFPNNYNNAASYVLNECFRCLPDILRISQRLIENSQDRYRIPKTVFSHYTTRLPNHVGQSHFWTFPKEHVEWEAIAKSCRKLIDAGMKPEDILILISNRQTQLVSSKVTGKSILQQCFEDLNVPIDTSPQKRYTDHPDGRFVFSILRIACDTNLNDYVAHRTLFGLLKGIGLDTCLKIRNSCLEYNLNFLDLFYNPLPENIFPIREKNLLEKARQLVSVIKDWNPDTTFDSSKDFIFSSLIENFSEAEGQSFLNQSVSLPSDMTLKEVVSFFGASNDESREAILTAVYDRLKIEVPEHVLGVSKVRVMTMHGAKGLEAQVVFIPGFETGLIPNEKTRRYSGLEYEAARQLYVSITRAKSALVISWAKQRVVYGKKTPRQVSSFALHLGGKFVDATSSGLSESAVKEIMASIDAINSLSSY